MEEMIKGMSQPQVTYSVSSFELAALAEKYKEEGKRAALEEIESMKSRSKPTLNRKEAMALLNVSESTIIHWGRKGLLRKIKYGHACYYYREDCERILMEGTEK